MATPPALALMLDGAPIAPGAPARIPLDDGLVRGDGVFEGMRCYGRRPRTPGAHLDRLARSAAVVGLAVDLDLLRAELAAFCGMTVEPDCAVRLMVTRGGQRIWREEPIPTPPEGMRLCPTPHRVTPLLIGAKTLSYAANMQAARLARAAGCHDALFVRADDGLVLEGPTWAFGWLEGDALVFPPLGLGVLDSITRRLAAEAVPVREREAHVDDLARADGALVLSTVQEAVPVSEVAAAVREVLARHAREAR
ncbi:MAG: aminotransferase class IV [Thermoleophilia bacterium]|nr:aminotransferase class IV [Thermoleophilia bacterium]